LVIDDPDLVYDTSHSPDTSSWNKSSSYRQDITVNLHDTSHSPDTSSWNKSSSYRQDITVNLHKYKCQTSSKIMYLLCKQHICYACEIFM